MIAQREREELQRNFDRYKNEIDLQHSRGMEKLKVESDELTKRTLADNMRRIQAETERMLAAAKKKSWCSNCTKEVSFVFCKIVFRIMFFNRKSYNSDLFITPGSTGFGLYSLNYSSRVFSPAHMP